jgi:CRP-like cAMP-binding protein
VGVSEALRLFVRRLEIRSVLAAQERAAVLAWPEQVQRFRANEDVIRLGDTVDTVCLVSDGILARVEQLVNGNRQVTALYVAGDMADLPSAMLPHASSGLVALTEATVHRIPHRHVLASADSLPGLARAFWRDCVVDTYIIAQWLLSLGRRDARARLAHLLCELSCRLAGDTRGQPVINLNLRQAHLADALGLTSVHVNRTLRVLREERAALHVGRRFEILDWDRLAAIAEFDPAYLHLNREETAAPAALRPE